MRIAVSLFLLSLLISIFSFETKPDVFDAAVDRGLLDYGPIDEASGLVASAENTADLWTHNDSGDKARIFLLDSTAKHRATFYLEGVEARDWEEIAAMKENNKNYLLIGDIGDNRARYAEVQIHKVKEPSFRGRMKDTIRKEDITTYTLRYEDGPRDAEAFFYDPIDRKLYVISKRDLRAGVYEGVLPKNASDTVVLQKKESLPYTFITSADISIDGTEVLIKNLLHVYYWKRKPGESIVQMLRRPGREQAYLPEPQGEAIAFARNGTGYYTTSERPFGLTAHLYFYPRIRK